MHDARLRNLSHIRSSASTSRVLNLVYLAERNGERESFHARPLFRNKRLNSTIIIKHTPRAHEQQLFGSYQASATKIIFPFDPSELQLGGRSIFFEEESAAAQIAGFLGVDPKSEDYVSDTKTMEEISKLPGLDPYLLRERVRTLGLDVAREYFAISDADADKISAITHAELQKLVRLAFANESARLGIMTDRLNKLFLTRESDDTLKPLTRAIGLPPDRHEETMFSWKGFIYYKWRMTDVMARLPIVIGQIKALRVYDASKAEREEIQSLVDLVLFGIEDALRRVKSSLSIYDAAFETMVEYESPTDFQRFLQKAPDAFEAIGDALSKISHIAAFWAFRFPEQTRIRISYLEAMDILEEFAGQLCAYTNPNEGTFAVA